MSRVFSFPDSINEYSARLVAGFVVVLTGTYLVWSTLAVLLFVSAGFLARVVAGPSLSPIAQLVTRVLTPALERFTGSNGAMVAGSPKRFAQAIGATLSTLAVVLHVSGVSTAALVVVAMVTFAATLEAVFGICLGCVIYAQLIKLGVFGEDSCVDCADISRRRVVTVDAS